MHELHDSPAAGHRGIAKTLRTVARFFVWPGLARDVADYVRSCPVCQATKADQQRPIGLLQPLPVPQHPWESISLDFIMGLPTTRKGHNAVLVVVDRLSKYLVCIPTTRTITAPQTAELLLQHVIALHGWPKSIVSDRDARFTGGFWQALFRQFGTKLAMSTANHPQTDGQTEVFNKVVKTTLRAIVEPHRRDWDTYLPHVMIAHNSAVSETTGRSPFEVVHGRPMVLPMGLTVGGQMGSLPRNEAAAVQGQELQAIIEDVRARMRAAQERQKRYADQHRRDHTFVVGDYAWLSTKNLRHVALPDSRVLSAQYIGPLRVVRVVGPNAVELQLPANYQHVHPVVNVSYLKPHRASQRFPGREHPMPPPELVDGVEMYEVEEIKGRERVTRGRRVEYNYLVAWKGYPSWEDSWEPEEHLDSARELVEAFDAQHPRPHDVNPRGR